MYEIDNVYYDDDEEEAQKKSVNREFGGQFPLCLFFLMWQSEFGFINSFGWNFGASKCSFFLYRLSPKCK